jgi:hypothetical protein
VLTAASAAGPRCLTDHSCVFLCARSRLFHKSQTPITNYCPNSRFKRSSRSAGKLAGPTSMNRLASPRDQSLRRVETSGQGRELDPVGNWDWGGGGTSCWNGSPCSEQLSACSVIPGFDKDLGDSILHRPPSLPSDSSQFLCNQTGPHTAGRDRNNGR